MLKEWCAEICFKAMEANLADRVAQGMHLQSKILDISDVEVGKETACETACETAWPVSPCCSPVLIDPFRLVVHHSPAHGRRPSAGLYL